jgi:hypothetical protein
MDDDIVAQALEASYRAACIDHRCKTFEVAAASRLGRTEKAVSWTQKTGHVLSCLNNTNLPSIQGTPFKAAAKQAWVATLLAAAERKSSEANAKLQTFLGVDTTDLDPLMPNDVFSSSINHPLALPVGRLQGSVGSAQVIAKSPAGQSKGTSLQESGKPPGGSYLPFTPAIPNSSLSPRGSLALVGASLHSDLSALRHDKVWMEWSILVRWNLLSH